MSMRTTFFASLAGVAYMTGSIGCSSDGSPLGAEGGGGTNASTGSSSNRASSSSSSSSNSSNLGRMSSSSSSTGGTGSSVTSAGSGSSSSTSSGASSSSSSASSSSGPSHPFPPNCTCLKLGPPACTPTGDVTYTLVKSASPTPAEQSAYDAITCAMEGAVAYYNCNTRITKAITVTYNTGVATADGNINGSIRFGGAAYMECVTAMHEISHTVGVGTASNWDPYSVGGVFTGASATAQLRAITGVATDTLHSDTHHFWPYGLNYESEAASTSDLVDHCLMVTAIRKDLGM